MGAKNKSAKPVPLVVFPVKKALTIALNVMTLSITYSSISLVFMVAALLTTTRLNLNSQCVHKIRPSLVLTGTDSMTMDSAF